MQKIYCYVDETGQDTVAQKDQGGIFIVALALAEENRDELERLCEQYEKASGKGKQKWHGANTQRRLRYMRQIIGDVHFKGVLCYLKYAETLTKTGFDLYTTLAIEKAIRAKAHPPYVAEVYVDGLSKDKRTEYSVSLRKLGLSRVILHRIRDEQSSALIRLADALAGLVRDAEEGKYEEAAHLIERGQRMGVVVRL